MSAADGTFCPSNKSGAACIIIKECEKVLSKDSITGFFEGLAKSSAECMPHVNKVHLPFFRKSEVYEAFRREHSLPHY